MFGSVFGKLFGGKGAEAEVTQPVGPLSGLSVLLMSADASARASDAGLLRVSGATVYEASDAASALSALQTRTFDAVVVDGDGEGFNFTRRLRGSPATERLAVVAVLSSSRDARGFAEAKNVGVSGLAARPHDAEMFARRILDVRARAAG